MIATLPLVNNPATNHKVVGPLRATCFNSLTAFCSGVIHTSQALFTLIRLVITVFTSLRMYAVWRKDCRILAGLLFIGLVPFGMNMFWYTRVNPAVAPPPLFGCVVFIHMSEDTVTTYVLQSILAFTSFATGFDILGDAIVLLLTCVKTIEVKRSCAAIRRQAKDSLRAWAQERRPSYVSSIQRDDLSLHMDDGMPDKCGVIRLSSILVSRFLLNLHSVYLSAGTNGQIDSSAGDLRMSSVAFAAHNRITGNLGAPLDDILSDSEERYALDDVEETIYDDVSADPLAAGLHSSPGERTQLP
ncbi:uncharacterized protein B0H18DRAFT_1045453 [Fomitopsis serialis]|uniref:uncharacterized protein n=1 Tax=Fomitopsis serialis TaxID=139415 RepID=UPI002007E36E|nr:uncharacterized protein B0H18DRAFT_1045453 [Neoantrodia serialis]KAH9914436.1 hypothetical protein B0H18DRAFT_1045453 [Neoantrodia serialis]